MFMTPFPIIVLVPAIQLRVVAILSMVLGVILMVVAIFVVIPIVIVLVGAIVHTFLRDVHHGARLETQPW